MTPGAFLAPGRGLRPVAVPPSVPVMTDRLAGATLDELLDAAAKNVWPNNACTAEWLLLRTWAIREASLLADEAEARAWAVRMRELNARRLDYAEWVHERLAAIEERARARKLEQTRLRYQFGFKQSRRWGLVARDVRALYQSIQGV